MPRRGNTPNYNSSTRRAERREVMRRSTRLQYALEIYIEMLREGNLNSWWYRHAKQQRVAQFAKYIFRRAGKLDALPIRADKIVEKLLEAYAEVMAERNTKLNQKNRKVSVSLNNGNVRRMMLGTANGRSVVVVNPSGNNVRNN
jgi:hypothetical protein